MRHSDNVITIETLMKARQALDAARVPEQRHWVLEIAQARAIGMTNDEIVAAQKKPIQYGGATVEVL